MIFTYLFEAKSIQKYLFSSGKLKDVIAASERLDRFIDSDGSSLLSQVINKAGIKSDLLDINTQSSNDMVHFLRCKGGAFYAYCHTEESLLKLRSIWTLTIQQLFPSLEFTDALSVAETLNKSIESSHKLLAADRNTPDVKFPIASAVSARYQRSGMAAVPPSRLAKKAAMKNEFDNDALDLDIEHHRQAYQALKMRTSAALQDRFSPDELVGEINYPINLEKDFAYSTKGLKENSDATKDLALVHIDGNGLGGVLRALKNELGSKDPEIYRKGFRLFSDALNKATINAAKKATQWLYKVAAYKSKDDKLTYLPMRPIVLGGDDVTLFCRADLALEFSTIFCKEFKIASETALKPLFDNYIQTDELKKYLTASGGILYAKASHPFTNSHHLAEELCSHAKKLTKSVNTNDSQVGPAALAFYRLSHSIAADFYDIYKQSQYHSLSGNRGITLGYSTYFVEDDIQYQQLSIIKEIVDLCHEKNTPVPMTKWRQMATQLAAGDLAEAERIYNRAVSLCLDNKKIGYLEMLLDKVCIKKTNYNKWYWEDDAKDINDGLQSIINDLLILDHFKAVIDMNNTEAL